MKKIENAERRHNTGILACSCALRGLDGRTWGWPNSPYRPRSECQTASDPWRSDSAINRNSELELTVGQVRKWSCVTGLVDHRSRLVTHWPETDSTINVYKRVCCFRWLTIGGTGGSRGRVTMALVVPRFIGLCHYRCCIGLHSVCIVW